VCVPLVERRRTWPNRGEGPPCAARAAPFKVGAHAVFARAHARAARARSAVSEDTRGAKRVRPLAVLEGRVRQPSTEKLHLARAPEQTRSGQLRAIAPSMHLVRGKVEATTKSQHWRARGGGKPTSAKTRPARVMNRRYLVPVSVLKSLWRAHSYGRDKRCLWPVAESWEAVRLCRDGYHSGQLTGSRGQSVTEILLNFSRSLRISKPE